MPLQIVRNDITLMKVDAIVNAANSSLLGGGGVDGCIHKAAGPGLKKECRTLGGCRTGDAKITGGYDLPAKYVIHTVGPIWHGGDRGEEELLESCYRRSLQIAAEHELESIAFPLISAGAYGYPRAAALNVAVRTISRFLEESDMLVYIVVYDRRSYEIGTGLYDDITAYIDENYVDEHPASRYRSDILMTARQSMPAHPRAQADRREKTARPESTAPCEEAAECYQAMGSSLEDALSRLDESFSEMLLRKIDERGLTDAQCYKKANIDRKLFSKIRSNPQYRPSKPTALAFAVALELTLPETQELLEKAGFALSHSSKADIIVEYFILNGNYNIFEINEALFAFDQNLLGSV